MVSYSLSSHKERTVRKTLLESMTFRGVLLGLCIVFGILYVAQMSSVSTKGYDIADLQHEIASLEQQKERLAIEIAKNSSMSNVQNRIATLNLVPVDTIEYPVLAANVARR
jgi:cell division protein FtsL